MDPIDKGSPIYEKILRDEGLTFSEKLLSIKRSDNPGKVAHVNEIIVVNVDFTMATDGTAPLATKVFEEMGAQKLWDVSKILFVIDHTCPPSSEQVAELQGIMKRFAKKHQIALEEGSICHQFILERYSVPGMLFIGADSHSTTNGCVGAFASGIGSTEVAAVWASGRIWLRVPGSIRVNIEGKFQKGVYAKDLILHIVGQLGLDGANYKAVEFTGSTVGRLSMSSRATLCNMGMEMGAKAAIIEFDAVTDAYLASVGRKALEEVHAGGDAQYGQTLEVDVNELEPLVAAPNSPDNVKGIGEVVGQPIDQAFLGSCTNARLEDLEVAVKVLRGRKVKEGVRMAVTPASKAVYLEALRTGYLEELLKAGAIITNSTCGACVGTHAGVLGPGEVCVSSSNRNFIGRMGARESKVYLASPATVAASAIEGAIADPRSYF